MTLTISFHSLIYSPEINVYIFIDEQYQIYARIGKESLVKSKITTFMFNYWPYNIVCTILLEILMMIAVPYKFFLSTRSSNFNASDDYLHLIFDMELLYTIQIFLIVTIGISF